MTLPIDREFRAAFIGMDTGGKPSFHLWVLRQRTMIQYTYRNAFSPKEKIPFFQHHLELPNLWEQPHTECLTSLGGDKYDTTFVWHFNPFTLQPGPGAPASAHALASHERSRRIAVEYETDELAKHLAQSHVSAEVRKHQSLVMEDYGKHKDHLKDHKPFFDTGKQR